MSELTRTAKKFYKKNLEPKVYDKEDHQNFYKWYFLKLHKILTKDEMNQTKKKFTYDMEAYNSLPNPSRCIEIR